MNLQYMRVQLAQLQILLWFAQSGTLRAPKNRMPQVTKGPCCRAAARRRGPATWLRAAATSWRRARAAPAAASRSSQLRGAAGSVAMAWGT